MSAKLLNYESKYVKDSIKQLNQGATVYAISNKMKRDIEQAIDNLGLDVTRETMQGYWQYTLKENER